MKKYVFTTTLSTGDEERIAAAAHEAWRDALKGVTTTEAVKNEAISAALAEAEDRLCRGKGFAAMLAAAVNTAWEAGRMAARLATAKTLLDAVLKGEVEVWFTSSEETNPHYNQNFSSNGGGYSQPVYKYWLSTGGLIEVLDFDQGEFRREVNIDLCFRDGWTHLSACAGDLESPMDEETDLIIQLGKVLYKSQPMSWVRDIGLVEE